MNRFTHIGVYGVIRNDSKILLIKKARGPHTGKWDLPGGTIEFGEEPFETLKREIREETGIQEIEAKIKVNLSYTLIHKFNNQLEELHHIGLIYDVEILNCSYNLKTEGDLEDSLEAKWVDIKLLSQEDSTPFLHKMNIEYNT